MTENTMTENTMTLSAAQEARLEARLRALMDARAESPDWPEKADAALDVMGTPEKRVALLLFCACGRTLSRLHLLTWDEFQAILEGRGSPALVHRLSRAMRLLRRVLRTNLTTGEQAATG